VSETAPLDPPLRQLFFGSEDRQASPLLPVGGPRPSHRPRAKSALLIPASSALSCARVGCRSFALVFFLPTNPGQVEIVWQGWQVATGRRPCPRRWPPVLAGSVGDGLAVSGIRVRRIIRGPPPDCCRRRLRPGGRRLDIEPLTQGPHGFCAGLPRVIHKSARRYARDDARKAGFLLADPPLLDLACCPVQASQLECYVEPPRQRSSVQLSQQHGGECSTGPGDGVFPRFLLRGPS